MYLQARGTIGGLRVAVDGKRSVERLTRGMETSFLSLYFVSYVFVWKFSSFRPSINKTNTSKNVGINMFESDCAKHVGILQDTEQRIQR